jgi:hypothetical protein
MKKLPTDREILKCIFDLYKSDYPGPKGEDGRGANDPFILIDLTKVAARLDCGTELIFGRLYYHLDAKYRYKQDNGARVDLFLLNLRDQGHAVHFPFLASLLAGFEEEHRKLFWSMVFSVTALTLSAISLVVNLVTKWK